MAEYHRLENWHDIISFCWGWSDLDKISETGAEWHVDCGDVIEIEASCRIPICRTFGCCHWANSMACHPRAMYHIAGCCQLVNSLSRFQNHMPHCTVQSPGEINVVITLQGARIPAAILKTVFAIFYFFKCSLGFDERRLSYRLRYTCFR